MDVGDWLRSLGLGQYEALFRQNDIDDEVLSDLTDGDLEKFGVSFGHRKRLLKAVASTCRHPRPHPPTSTPITPASGRRRAPPAHGDVLRPRRLDRAVGAARSRGYARGRRRLSMRR